MNERHRYFEAASEAQQERQDKLKAALALLEQGIEGILDSEGFANYLRTMARFPTYSAKNVALIMAQRPEATQVAGYKAWQALGRQVRKGEKGLCIFVPHRVRVRESLEEGQSKRPDGEGENETTQLISGFGLGRVFDIAQTDGEPLPEPPAPEELAESVDVAREVNLRLSRWLIDEGVTVESKQIHGHAKGYWQPARNAIVIRSDRVTDEETGETTPLSDPFSPGKTKTLAHEAAHYLADHRGAIDRRDAETVAEGAAFVVLARYGIDTGAYSFPYVARWAEDKVVLRRNLAEVQGVPAGLIAGIEEAEHKE